MNREEPLKNRILEHWNRNGVESMYDKHLLKCEIELILKHIEPGAKILDAGCGEGEGTEAYASVPETTVHAADYSQTRLKKAARRLEGRDNVVIRQVDFLGDYSLDNDYDVIVTQRFLINLMEWPLQLKVAIDLMELLKPGGNLVMMEGCRQGADALNAFRSACGLDPIPPKWHNLFLDDEILVEEMRKRGYPLVGEDGLGAFHLLTRGIRPLLDEELNWDSDFNRLAASPEIDVLLDLRDRFSRLKLWVFRKPDTVSKEGGLAESPE